MTTTYGKLGYCFRVLGFLECRPFAVCAANGSGAGTTARRPTDTNASRRLPDSTRPLRGRPHVGVARDRGGCRRSVGGLLVVGRLSGSLHPRRRRRRVVHGERRRADRRRGGEAGRAP